MSSLGARLLDGPSSEAAAAAGGRRWAQRAASWHGPDPSLALMLVLALAGCACCMEQRWRVKGRPSTQPGAAAADLAAMGSDGLGPEAAAGQAQPGPVLVAILATTLGAIICQYISEKLAVNLVAEAFQGMKQLGIVLERRSARAWICPGRLTLRNCIVRNPEGYRGDYLLLVRGVTAEVGVWRLLSSLGSDVRLRRLCVEDVDVVLEESGLPAGGRSNVEAMLCELSNQQKSQPRTGRRLHVGEVTIKSVGVQVGSHRTLLPDICFDDFSAATGADSARGAAAALVAAVARATLESRAKAGSS